MATVRYFSQQHRRGYSLLHRTPGIPMEQNFGPFAIVSRDDLQIWLSDPRTFAARPMTDGSVPSPGGWNRLVIQVDGLASLVERLKGQGIHFRNEIISGVGGKQILAEDPSGNPIELQQPS